jgi:enoyl-CoA hydratase
MSVGSAVTSVSDGPVAVITMDDGKVNAFDDGLIDGVHAALDRAAGARAVVLAGREGVFSGGFDLGVVSGGGPAGQALVERGGELLGRLATHPAPIVTACTGHAVALGAVLLLATHYRLAADADVRIGLNEVAIGMPLPPFLLALGERRLNPARRTEAMLLARLWSPTEAVDVGFVDEVVPTTSVVDTAVARAKELAGRLQPDAFAATASLMAAGVSEGGLEPPRP